MSAVRRWSLTTKAVVASPGFFFENFNLRDGYGFPVAYVLVSAVVGAALFGAAVAVAVVALGSGGTESALTAGAVFGGVGLLLSVVGFLTRVVAAHAVVALTEGGPFVRTVEAFAYPTAATMILGAAPVVGFVAPLYGYYLQYKGLASFQGMEQGPAAAAIIVANVVSAVILTVFVFVVLPVLIALVGLAALAALG
ncbi:MAG: hypothetical protein ABEJ43_10190 [Haloferacaceae archaeon]